LFHLSPERKLMTVDITTKPAFQAGSPKPLFTVPISSSSADVQRSVVSADGKSSWSSPTQERHFDADHGSAELDCPVEAMNHPVKMRLQNQPANVALLS
jgi:hypothetical protein